jgi:large subunit ribosomal protein L24
MKIKRGDRVQVLVGDDRSAAPRKVLQVKDGGKRLIVEGVNRVYRHVKKNHPKSPQGGRLSLELPIDVSNVMLYCDACSRGVRVGYQVKEDGSKNRVCKRCNADLGLVTPARKKVAK